MAKQREFRQYQYAYRLANCKTGDAMDDFKLRAKLYGNDWKLKIWKLRNEIKRDGL